MLVITASLKKKKKKKKKKKTKATYPLMTYLNPEYTF